MPMHDLLTTSDTAKLLGVTPRTVARYVDNGNLVPVFRAPGRLGAYFFERDAVEALAEARGVKRLERAS